MCATPFYREVRSHTVAVVGLSHSDQTEERHRGRPFTGFLWLWLWLWWWVGLTHCAQWWGGQAQLSGLVPAGHQLCFPPRPYQTPHHYHLPTPAADVN